MSPRGVRAAPGAESEIRTLAVPINTVKTYVRSIYNKLGISSRRSAVLAGYEHGFIATPPAGTGYPVTLSG